MKRAALIIGSPGERTEEDYLEGVKKDVVRYQRFLKSALGGAWLDGEINVMLNPTLQGVLGKVRMLRSSDYSIVVFCGHGYHSEAAGETIVQLKPGVEMNSDALRTGGRKQTLVLDCCRVISADVLVEGVQKREAPQLDDNECRTYYDKRLQECPHGLVVLFGCSMNETAGDSATNGGYYSSSFMNAAVKWLNTSSTDTSKEAAFLSVVAAHERAGDEVRRLSGNRQNPDIEKPRAGPYFPFAVIA